MRRPGWLQDLVDPLRRRLRRMSVDQMAPWVDVAGTDTSRALSQHLRTRDEVSLREAERGLATLVALVDCLRERQP